MIIEFVHFLVENEKFKVSEKPSTDLSCAKHSLTALDDQKGLCFCDDITTRTLKIHLGSIVHSHQ